jgi:hypothetical protein
MSVIDGIAGALAKVGIESRLLEDDRGSLALVCGYGGRVIAWQPKGTKSSVLWTHPDLDAVRSVEDVNRLRGGPGGLRLWFSPEWSYCWEGEPDALRFSNYITQPAAAAGNWKLRERSHRCVTAETCDEMNDIPRRERIRFDAERTIALFSTPPDEVQDLDAVFSGISLQQRLLVSEAVGPYYLDLWNILQVPQRSRLLIPVRPGLVPDVYYKTPARQEWSVDDGLVERRIGGGSETKWGLSASAVTGRVGAIIPSEGRLACLLVWNHPVHPGLPYPDGPRRGFDRSQVVQSWDGFGFGEIEYHSPAATPDMPLVLDSSTLWSFMGELPDLLEAARRLLGRKIHPT